MTDVAVLGAGPYGLAAVAALRATGTDVVAFGRPMSFWAGHMPTGMLLRSPYVASSIGRPRTGLDLDAFAAERGAAVPEPVPLEDFIEYGLWFQRRTAPDVDRRQVTRIERGDGGFELRLDDGDVVAARSVVVAAGIEPFAHLPSLLRKLPPALVSHTSAPLDLTRFAEALVLVVGGGQSALEGAALMHEAGAHVHLVVRASTVRWRGQRPWLRQLGPMSRLMYAPAEVGPPLLCRLVERPGACAVLPAAVRHKVDVWSVPPAGGGWLRPRVVGTLRMSTGRAVVSAEPVDGRVRVTFDDGTAETYDHVLAGTGYRVDITRYPFLEPLLGSIWRRDGYPLLRRGFESSVPGLHFLGAPAAASFGPLMRFVAGTSFSASELVRIAGSGARPRRLANVRG
jgi:thioredoxin reductase